MKMQKKQTFFVMIAALGLVLATVAMAHDDNAEAVEGEAPEQGDAMHGDDDDHMVAKPGMGGLMMPNMDAAMGRKLFAAKGCVACHAINGVGGHDAAALDAHTMDAVMNPFEFAAKMWAMAPATMAAQEEGLDGQILFTGEELAHIIAFVHNDDEQHHFSEADIPPEVMPMMHHKHGDDEMSGMMEHAEEIGHEHDAEEEDHHDD